MVHQKEPSRADVQMASCSSCFQPLGSQTPELSWSLYQPGISNSSDDQSHPSHRGRQIMGVKTFVI